MLKYLIIRNFEISEIELSPTSFPTLLALIRFIFKAEVFFLQIPFHTGYFVENSILFYMMNNTQAE